MKRIINKIWCCFKQKLCQYLQRLNNDRVFFILGFSLITISLFTIHDQIYSRQLDFQDWSSFLFASSYNVLTIPGMISIWLTAPGAFSVFTVFPLSTLGIYCLSRISYFSQKCKSIVGSTILFLSAYSLAGETFSPSSIHHFGDSGPIWVPGIFLSISAIIGFFILFDTNRIFWGPILLLYGASYLGLWLVDLVDFFYGRYYYQSEKYNYLAMSLVFLSIGIHLCYANKNKILKKIPKNSLIRLKYLLRSTSFAAFIVSLSFLYCVHSFIPENYWLFASFFAIHLVLILAIYYSDFTNNFKAVSPVIKETYSNFMLASHVLGAFVVLFIYPYFYYFILSLAVTTEWYGLPFFSIGIIGILSQSAELILLRHSQISLELYEN